MENYSKEIIEWFKDIKSKWNTLEDFNNNVNIHLYIEDRDVTPFDVYKTFALDMLMDEYDEEEALDMFQDENYSTLDLSEWIYVDLKNMYENYKDESPYEENSDELKVLITNESQKDLIEKFLLKKFKKIEWVNENPHLIIIPDGEKINPVVLGWEGEVTDNEALKKDSLELDLIYQKCKRNIPVVAIGDRGCQLLASTRSIRFIKCNGHNIPHHITTKSSTIKIESSHESLLYPYDKDGNLYNDCEIIAYSKNFRSDEYKDVIGNNLDKLSKEFVEIEVLKRQNLLFIQGNPETCNEKLYTEVYPKFCLNEISNLLSKKKANKNEDESYAILERTLNINPSEALYKMLNTETGEIFHKVLKTN